jgi:hypothetical protein
MRLDRMLAGNWGEEAPRKLEIIELRRLFTFGFNASFQPVAEEYASRIGEIDDSDLWSVSQKSTEGNLVLFYRTAPESFVRDIFIIDGPVRRVVAGWKDGYDSMAAIRRIATLSNPLSWKQLKTESKLAQAGFVKSQMQGRPQASNYWAILLDMIVSVNAGVKIRQIHRFGNRIKGRLVLGLRRINFLEAVSFRCGLSSGS